VVEFLSIVGEVRGDLSLILQHSPREMRPKAFEKCLGSMVFRENAFSNLSDLRES